MLTVQLSCPHCRRILRSRRLIAPGECLLCPHCSMSFRAGADSAQPAERASAFGSRLMRWLVLANMLVLVGGGGAIAWAIHRRVQWEGERASVSHSVPLSVPEESPSIPPTTTPKTDKPAAPADPMPKPPNEPPPTPLPDPPPPRAKSPLPPKAKAPEPEPLREPAEARREKPQPSWLPQAVQRQVDLSIAGGIEFLRRDQHADGSWGRRTGKTAKQYTPGITALCGLTLLECGVPTADAQVRATAHYLRLHMPELTATYSISLAILFFDRLGDDGDTSRIRTLAMRLLAGQKPSGGWDYYCPTLNDEEELGLLARLYKDRPTKPLDLFDADPKANVEDDLYRPRPSKSPPLGLFVSRGVADVPASTPKIETPPPKVQSPKPKVESKKLPGDNRLLSKRAETAAENLPDRLKKTPALRAAELLRNPPDFSEPRTDNSNTQFAILGLLAAENHDVPMERAMSLLDWRFRNSQTPQFGWNYRPKWPTTPSMTAAALMGLALKHGLLLPNRRGRGRNIAVHDDEVVHRGFTTLKALLEDYYAGFVLNRTPLDKLDLYCLWTIERVAVLYNLRALDSLDWYGSGVQLLLPLQRDDGSWSPKGTTCLEESSVATSFALLFLKRSNLARDLSERLNAPREE